MDNLDGLLNSVLGDPEMMGKLRGVAQQFGIDPDLLSGAATESADKASSDSGGSAEQSSDKGSVAPSEIPMANSPAAVDANMLAAVAKITPLLGKLREEDDMTRLLHALRPYLSGERRKKADEADKIMAILRLIPLLRTMGDTDGRSE